MSATSSQKIPKLAPVDIGGGSQSEGRSGSRPSGADPAGTGTLGPVPPPLPSDPSLRAELFARLDRGIAEARSGREVAWEELDRRTRAKHRLPPA